MPKYSIISEPDPAAERRMARGARTQTSGLRTIVEADSLAEAIVDARDTQPHCERRIVSAEELRPAWIPDDETITAALNAADIWADEFIDPTTPLYDSIHFADYVDTVIEVLRDSELVPGLTVTWEMGPDAYAMVEIFDEVRSHYFSQGLELKRLIDRRAVGWDGVLSIAHSLIEISNPLQ